MKVLYFRLGQKNIFLKYTHCFVTAEGSEAGENRRQDHSEQVQGGTSSTWGHTDFFIFFGCLKIFFFNLKSYYRRQWTVLLLVHLGTNSWSLFLQRQLFSVLSCQQWAVEEAQSELQLKEEIIQQVCAEMAFLSRWGQVSHFTLEFHNKM